MFVCWIFRLMFGFTLLPSLCMIAALCFLFETPRWLVYNGKVEKAYSVMKKIRSSEYVEKELNEIIKDFELNCEKKLGILLCVCVQTLCTFVYVVYMFVCVYMCDQDINTLMSSHEMYYI